MHKEQPSQIKKRPPKPTPTRPKLVGTGVQKGLLKTPVDVSDKTKPTYFDGMPTIEAEMKPHKLPVYDAEYFDQEIKRLGMGKAFWDGFRDGYVKTFVFGVSFGLGFAVGLFVGVMM